VKLKLNTRTLGLIAGICILAYAAAGYFLVISPKKSEAVRLDEQIAATSVELQAARAANAAQNDAQPIAVADIFRLAKAMPNNPDMPGILLELSRVAEETGIHFTSIVPQSAGVVGSYQSMPIDVSFDGSFYALSDFLFRLRTLVSVRRGELHAAGRLFSVERVDFSEGSTGFPTLTAALKLQAYVFGTDASGSAVPAPLAPESSPPPAEVPTPPTNATAAGASG
jgi:type IV pilus assembly PilO-like protein